MSQNEQQDAQQQDKATPAGESRPGPLSHQPAKDAPSEGDVHQGAAKQAEDAIKPSSPGETGTTPGTNWNK